MKKFFILLISPFLFAFLNLDIVQTSSFLPIEIELKKAKTDTLVILMIKDTIFIYKNNVLLPVNKKHFMHYFKKYAPEYLKKHRAKNTNELLEKLLAKQKVKFVDYKLPKLLYNLEAKGIDVLCMDYKSNETREQKYLNWLEDEKISFKQSFKKLVSFILIAKNGIYKNNIIFLNKVYFNEFWEKFFTKHKQRYYKVIFVSADKKSVVMMQDVCKKLQINFVGFEYMQAYNINYVEDKNIIKAEVKRMLEEL